MKTLIIASSILACSSAWAGSHVGTVTLSAEQTPISNLRVTSVEYGNLTTSWGFDPNCTPDANCQVIVNKAPLVRVTVEYNSTFDRGDLGDSAGSRWESQNIDFDPSQFTAQELAAIKDHGRDLFAVSASTRRVTEQVMDPTQSETCLNYSDETSDFSKPGCTPHLVYKSQEADYTSITVQTK